MEFRRLEFLEYAVIHLAACRSIHVAKVDSLLRLLEECVFTSPVLLNNWFVMGATVA